MRKGKNHAISKNVEIYNDLCGKPLKRDWVAGVTVRPRCSVRILNMGKMG